MFKVYWDLSGLNLIKDAMVATFFDIYEDVSSELSYVFKSLIAIYISHCSFIVFTRKWNENGSLKKTSFNVQWVGGGG